MTVWLGGEMLSEKSGVGIFTTSVAVVVCVRLPLVPVTVSA